MPAMRSKGNNQTPNGKDMPICLSNTCPSQRVMPMPTKNCVAKPAYFQKGDFWG